MKEDLKGCKGRAWPQRFAWNVVTSQLPPGRGPRAKILDNIRGYADAGTFTAILGPSGAGKTTLLDCLSLRNKDFTGLLTLDGTPVRDALSALGAYVYQTDLSHCYLTVREHLVFQAINKLRGSCSEEECRRRVEQVMCDLHLELVANSRLGGAHAGLIIKGISGGERKRLHIASELLADPAILFLDEPTTGLDANVAEVVCRRLALLSTGLTPRIVLASMHAPSARLLSHVTHLLVLAWNGQMAYFGKRDQVASYVAKLDLPCPVHENPADFILFLASKRVCKGDAAGTVTLQGSDRAEVSIDGLEENENYRRLVEACDSQLPPFEQLALPPGREARLLPPSAEERRKGAPMLTLLWTNLQRSYIEQTRGLPAFLTRLAQDVILGVMAGLLHRSPDGQPLSPRSLMSLLVTIQTFTAIKSSMNALVYMPTETQFILREYFAGSNGGVPYFIAQTLLALAFCVFQLATPILAYATAGHTISRETLTATMPIWFLHFFGCYCLGFMGGAATSNFVVSAIVATKLLGPMIVCGGHRIERSQISPSVRWIADMSFLRHSLAALAIFESRHLEGEGQRYLLEFLRIQPEHFTPFCHLMLLWVTLAWCTGLALIMIRFRLSKAV